VSDFGDYEDDDAFDREPADPEQVSFRLHRLRIEVDALAGSEDLPTFDELEPESQALALSIGDAIVDYIRTHEPDRPDELARHLHEARRYVASSRLARWEDLPEDDRAVGVALMSLLIGWLARQGALG
jgi:hypothetical protein